jgi:hypothetical protein
MMKMRKITTYKGIMLVMSLVLMLSTVGCIFSPDEDDDVIVDPPAELQYADTPDKLMENFETIYTDMLIDDFRDMLHTDYRTILLTGTINDWGWEAGYTFDRDDEIIIHTHMFDGSPGSDENGNNINPLDRIEVSLFEREGEWITVPQDDVDFPGTKRAIYNVRIFFHDNTGGHAFEVNQSVIFYAQAMDDNGRTKYLLRGQRGIEGP